MTTTRSRRCEGAATRRCRSAGVHAAMATLSALIHRDSTGVGQHVDVSVLAACNVTTESGTFVWLVAGQTVQRQTGRHACHHSDDGGARTGGGRPLHDYWVPAPEARTRGRCSNGSTSSTCARPVLRCSFSNWASNAAASTSAKDFGDPEVLAILGAGRAALMHIAANIPALDFFEGAQGRDLQCGIIFSPEEAYENRHFRARGFQVG